MFKKRTRKKELIDKTFINKEDLIQNLREFEIINRWFGTCSTLVHGLNRIHRKKYDIFTKKIRIADLGCGAGDLLKVIHKWTERKTLACQLFGIDKDKTIVQYAKKNSKPSHNIQYKQQNIFSKSFIKQKYDIVCLSNVCHHFTTRELKLLLQNLIKQTRHVIILNDLHRHYIPYWTIKYLSKIFKLSNLACHDGPLSVLKAFNKKELLHILSCLKKGSFYITWRWPFRWLVIIDCK